MISYYIIYFSSEVKMGVKSKLYFVFEFYHKVIKMLRIILLKDITNPSNFSWPGL